LKVKARYIAPVSMYINESSCATILETVLLPAAAGPSIAIAIPFVFMMIFHSFVNYKLDGTFKHDNKNHYQIKLCKLIFRIITYIIIKVLLIFHPSLSSL